MPHNTYKFGMANERFYYARTYCTALVCIGVYVHIAVNTLKLIGRTRCGS